jgi:uncharacterized membrane protein YjgN (DUF898 family)
MGDPDALQPAPSTDTPPPPADPSASPPETPTDAAIAGTLAAPSAEPPVPASEPFEFSATPSEYFRIWIANTFLTLITLGVYAAWAKVRKKRYLYGHTRLLGHAFDYTARPRSLFTGNIVVAVLFLGYAFFGEVYWQVQLATVALAAFVVPWLIVRALAFNARNTCHRGLSFRYRGRYGMALLVYVAMPIGCVLTLGGLYPAFAHERKKLAINFLRFGDCTFQLNGRTGAFYKIYFKAVLWIVLAGLIMSLAAAIINAASDTNVRGQTAFVITQSVVAFIFFWIARLQVRANRFNYVWNNTTADAHRFEASMRFGELLKIQVVNTLAIVGSLGLALPWATIRTTRYTLSCLRFIPASPVDKIERFGAGQNSTAVGESAADFFGVDIGL